MRWRRSNSRGRSLLGARRSLTRVASRLAAAGFLTGGEDHMTQQGYEAALPSGKKPVDLWSDKAPAYRHAATAPLWSVVPP